MAAQTTTVSPHIAFDESGRPVIAGTRFKVSIIVGYHNQGRMSAEQIAKEFAGVLTKPQIYAALLYYYEHQAEMDVEAEKEREWLEQFFREHGTKVTRAELEARLESSKKPN